MSGAKINLSSTAGELQNDGQGNARVNLPLTEEHAGFAVMVAENDSGAVTGSRQMRSVEVSNDFRLRAGVDQILFSLSFEGTNIARDRLLQTDSTMTAAQASGFLSINSGNVTANTNACNIRTYRTFPVFGSYTTYLDIWGREANASATNAVSEWGAGYVSGTSAPTDGVMFRRNSSGQLKALLNFGGTETEFTVDTTNIPARDGVGLYDPAEVSHFLFAIHNDVVDFWINDTLLGSVKTPANQGAPTFASSWPVFARVYDAGVASAARRFEFAGIAVSIGDMATNKPYGHVMAGMGGGAYQVQPGTASGPTVTRAASTTAGWPNSAQARGAGTWTATSAPAINSLGGQWQSPAISSLTSEADYPVFSYLNPAGSASVPGRTLYITGVKWGKTVALVAASTNSINLNYIVGVGGTTSAVGQTESASVVAARGIVLDTIPFKATAAVGDYVEGGNMSFGEAPLVVPPGCYVTFVVRPFGTVTSNTLVVGSSVAFVGYHE